MFDNLLKKMPLMVAAMGLASFVFGDTDCSSKCCEPAPCEKICEPPAKPYDQGYAICEDQMVGGYNAPARIDVRCAWDVFVNASMLYMQVKEFGLDPAIVSSIASEEPFISKGKPVHLDSDYKFGFKVGLGMSFNHDNWYSMVEYTRLHGTYSKNTTIKDMDHEFIFPGWMTANNIDISIEGLSVYASITQAKSKWEPGIDLLDFTLGRSYYVGTMLTFKPYGSIRWGWINQEYDQKLAEIAEISIAQTIFYETLKLKMHARSHSWLIGPKMGLDINWLFRSGFRLFSNAAAALLYQHHEINYHVNDFASSTSDGFIPFQNVLKDEDCSFLTPNLQLVMGLGWGTYFNNNSWHAELLAGYSFEIFFNQNRMQSLRLFATDKSDAGSLIMHGLVVTAGLDF